MISGSYLKWLRKERGNRCGEMLSGQQPRGRVFIVKGFQYVYYIDLKMFTIESWIKNKITNKA